jgi:uncharacterized membrane protein YheB (UPF0754 family)
MNAIENQWLLDHNELYVFESDNETAELEIDLQLSMQEKLARAIDKEMNSKISSKSRTTKDVTNIVKKELAFFKVEGKRGANLESWYRNLNSIPSSSVDPERLFQDMEELLPKFDHLYLHDESVDKLTFLRGYFKRENY